MCIGADARRVVATRTRFVSVATTAMTRLVEFFFSPIPTRSSHAMRLWAVATVSLVERTIGTI